MGPHPAVAAIRLAVRRVLRDVLEDAAASTDRTATPSPRAPAPPVAPRPSRLPAAAPAARPPAPPTTATCPAPPEAPAAPPGRIPQALQAVEAGRSTRAADASRAAEPLRTTSRARPAEATWPAEASPAAEAIRTTEAHRVAEAIRTAPPASGPSVPSGASVPDGSPGPEVSSAQLRPDAPRGPVGPRGPLVLVACSGGADSMALASALAFEAPKLGIRAGGITVDHGLQDGSELRAAEVTERLAALGLDPVEAVAVTVGRDGGPEAAARDARYAALDAAAERHGAVAVLLGHTRDDQAETVLLGLARGSGTRSLSGMAAVSGGPGAEGRYRRPFLYLDRQTARRACLAQALPVWDDPHNTDPGFTRSRLRHEGLPALEKALGKGVVEALARTARLSRDDADALDAWADQAEAAVRDSAGLLECAGLRVLPPAVRRRILRRAAIRAGAPAGSLFARHIEEIDRLITGWRGQGAINLPGRVVARRQDGRLVLRQG